MKHKRKQKSLPDDFFVKFNARNFDASQVTSGYALGGVLKSALQGGMTGAQFGPWGAVGGAAIGAFGNLLQNHQQKKQAYTDNLMSNVKPANPYGNLEFELGGKRYTYGEGGFTEFKGNTHEKGGIPYKGVEVEDGETEYKADGQPYIFSNRLTNPLTGKTIAQESKALTRKLGKRTDPITKKTMDLGHKQLSQVNETLKGIEQLYRWGGKRKKYNNGGPRVKPNVFVDPLGGVQLNPLSSSAAGLRGTSLNRFNQAVNANVPPNPQPMNTVSFYDEGFDTNNFTPNPVNVNGQGTPSVGGGNTKFNPLTAFGNLSQGDKFQLAGAAIPALYNLGRGLFGRAEQVKPDYNEYNSTMRNRAANMNIDLQSLYNQDQMATNALTNALRASTTGSGALRSNLQQAYANQGERRANISLQEQREQNALNQYRNQLDMNIGNANSIARERARMETAANRTAKDNLIGAGFTELGNALGQTGKAFNTSANNQNMLSLLSTMFPNFTPAQLQEFLKGRGGIQFRNN